MSQSASTVFVESLKSLIKSLVKLLFIAFAWAMRLLGLLLTKIGEVIERIIVKKNS